MSRRRRIERERKILGLDGRGDSDACIIAGTVARRAAAVEGAPTRMIHEDEPGHSAFVNRPGSERRGAEPRA